ncbi:hypothetical protein C8F04DRAFT_1276152 [Mycena alexandri]|uniref:Uncharacterized protein n=1 Tax=Mycena alexandri TaxID=1745969 RepID=A0AAD6WNS7_9AGAR|nr:hypothetical protein C8F04DRAFT_1276152 [Mycena alexandri]
MLPTPRPIPRDGSGSEDSDEDSAYSKDDDSEDREPQLDPAAEEVNHTQNIDDSVCMPRTTISTRISSVANAETMVQPGSHPFAPDYVSAPHSVDHPTSRPLDPVHGSETRSQQSKYNLRSRQPPRNASPRPSPYHVIAQLNIEPQSYYATMYDSNGMRIARTFVGANGDTNFVVANPFRRHRVFIGAVAPEWQLGPSPVVYSELTPIRGKRVRGRGSGRFCIGNESMLSRRAPRRKPPILAPRGITASTVSVGIEYAQGTTEKDDTSFTESPLCSVPGSPRLSTVKVPAMTTNMESELEQLVDVVQHSPSSAAGPASTFVLPPSTIDLEHSSRFSFDNAALLSVADSVLDSPPTISTLLPPPFTADLGHTAQFNSNIAVPPSVPDFVLDSPNMDGTMDVIANGCGDSDSVLDSALMGGAMDVAAIGPGNATKSHALVSALCTVPSPPQVAGSLSAGSISRSPPVPAPELSTVHANQQSDIGNVKNQALKFKDHTSVSFDPLALDVSVQEEDVMPSIALLNQCIRYQLFGVISRLSIVRGLVMQARFNAIFSSLLDRCQSVVLGLPAFTSFDGNFPFAALHSDSLEELPFTSQFSKLPAEVVKHFTRDTRVVLVSAVSMARATLSFCECTTDVVSALRWALRYIDAVLPRTSYRKRRVENQHVLQSAQDRVKDPVVVPITPVNRHPAHIPLRHLGVMEAVVVTRLPVMEDVLPAEEGPPVEDSPDALVVLLPEVALLLAVVVEAVEVAAVCPVVAPALLMETISS